MSKLMSYASDRSGLKMPDRESKLQRSTTLDQSTGTSSPGRNAPEFICTLLAEAEAGPDVGAQSG